MDEFTISPDVWATQESSGVVATDTILKNLLSKKTEIESVISLEKNRTLEEVKKRDTLKQNLSTIETWIETWQDITEKVNEDAAQGILSAASDEVKQLVDDQEKVQKDIVLLFVNVADSLDVWPFTEETTIEDIQKAYPTFKKIAHNVLDAYESDLKKAEHAREEFVNQKEKELEQIMLEIERTKYVKKTQLSQAVTRVLSYIGIFLGLLFIQYVSGRILFRFQEDFSRPHKEAMWFIHRWSFRGIFLIAFLVLFSSEFSAFLPFIAIMATAIGFALRDVVYSFIGWFMIGASDGYQEWDIIQVEDLQGKVFKITPLLTTLEEHGEQWVTGKMVSFPNKIIFDKTIKNYSRAHGFTFVSLDFIMTHESNIDRAREVLMGIIWQQDLTLYYRSRSVINKLRYTYGYNDADLHPRIDVIIDPKGVILRAKVFAHIEDVFDMRTKISESFCKKIQAEDTVKLQKG